MVERIITSENSPIKLWLREMDDGALQQAKNIANLPFIHSHVAIMPDAHMGYGMPIGGVMATRGVVIPNAVGVDIGCGMCALRTSLTSLDSDRLKAVMKLIRKSIPLGFQHHKKPQDSSLMPLPENIISLEELPVVRREYANALTQLGTLGGGNHFIEIQRGSDGFLWIMIHSGSRNIGYRVAEHYNRLAVSLAGKYGQTVPAKQQLASLPCDSPEGRRYLREMEFCVDFALANRRLMMERVKAALEEVAGPVRFDNFVNIAHNYARLEHHFQRDVMVHRKGATSARSGEIGIIPGCQGMPSYLVRGKGNPESFTSCSHGAGRKMGRRQARKRLDLKRERQRLEEQGILHAVRGKRDLDEAPGAYKDIDRVIEDQLDLVEVIVTLHPLAVIKG